MTVEKIKEKIKHYEKMLAAKERSKYETFLTYFYPSTIDQFNLYIAKLEFALEKEFSDDDKIYALEMIFCKAIYKINRDDYDFNIALLSLDNLQKDIENFKKEMKLTPEDTKVEDFKNKYPGLTENWD